MHTLLQPFFSVYGFSFLETNWFTILNYSFARHHKPSQCNSCNGAVTSCYAEVETSCQRLKKRSILYKQGDHMHQIQGIMKTEPMVVLFWANNLELENG